MTENPPTPEAGKDDKSVPSVVSPAVSSVESAHKTVELFTKIFVVIAAVLYVTGFLVVSLHLARYGVHSFSILRAQYILAGAWFFAHILFFTPFAIAPWYLMQRALARSRVFKKDSFLRITGSEWFGIIFSMGFIYFFLFFYEISIFKFDSIVTLAGYGSITISLLFFGIFIRYFHSRFLVQESYSYMLGLGFVSLIFMNIFVFSVGVYSKISAEYGGGKPVQVQFHWKDECKTKDIAATFQKECKLKEEPVYFDQILATDTDHVIISPCPKEYPRTFEISNDLIDYVEIKY